MTSINQLTISEGVSGPGTLRSNCVQECLNAKTTKGKIMKIAMEQTAAVVEMKECFNCAEVHEVEEMSHCIVCNGHACMYCSCNCVPIAE